MRILVTGSSGRVGQAVAAHLGKHHEIVGIDQTPGKHTGVVGDIRDEALMARQVENIDAVIHLASLHAPHVGHASRADFESINVTATAQLLALARNAQVQRFLFASSTSIYGHAMNDKSYAVWVTEALQPEPADIYDETKLKAEALCAAAFSPDFITASLRLSRCFPEPVRETALYRLYRGVDLRDVSQAFELTLLTMLSQFETFNISGDTPFQENDCVALKQNAATVLKKRVANIEADFLRQGWTFPSQIDRVYVIEKAMQQLGYAPQFGYKEFMNAI